MASNRLQIVVSDGHAGHKSWRKLLRHSSEVKYHLWGKSLKFLKHNGYSDANGIPYVLSSSLEAMHKYCYSYSHELFRKSPVVSLYEQAVLILNEQKKKPRNSIDFLAVREIVGLDFMYFLNRFIKDFLKKLDEPLMNIPDYVIKLPQTMENIDKSSYFELLMTCFTSDEARFVGVKMLRFLHMLSLKVTKGSANFAPLLVRSFIRIISEEDFLKW